MFLTISVFVLESCSLDRGGVRVRIPAAHSENYSGRIKNRMPLTSLTLPCRGSLTWRRCELNHVRASTRYQRERCKMMELKYALVCFNPSHLHILQPLCRIINIGWSRIVIIIILQQNTSPTLASSRSSPCTTSPREPLSHHSSTMKRAVSRSINP